MIHPVFLVLLAQTRLSPVNSPPVVDVGADQGITLPDDATIDATVTDDGLPIGGSLTVLWTKQSGPGTVTFSPNATTVDVTASFSVEGTYVLRLTADDGELSGFDELTVTVNPSEATSDIGSHDVLGNLPD